MCMCIKWVYRKEILSRFDLYIMMEIRWLSPFHIWNQTKETCRDACCDRVRNFAHLNACNGTTILWSTNKTQKLHTNWSQECDKETQNRKYTINKSDITNLSYWTFFLSAPLSLSIAFIHFHSWFLSFISFSLSRSLGIFSRINIDHWTVNNFSFSVNVAIFTHWMMLNKSRDTRMCVVNCWLNTFLM